MCQQIVVHDTFPSIMTAIYGTCNEMLLETLADYTNKKFKLETGKSNLALDCVAYSQWIGFYPD